MKEFYFTADTRQDLIILERDKHRVTYPRTRAWQLYKIIQRAISESNLKVADLKKDQKIRFTEEAGQRLALAMMACDPGVDAPIIDEMVGVIREMSDDRIQMWYAACAGPLGVEKVWDFRDAIFKDVREGEETE